MGADGGVDVSQDGGWRWKGQPAEVGGGSRSKGAGMPGGRRRRRSSVATALSPGDLSAVLKHRLVSLASFQKSSSGRVPHMVGPDAVDAPDDSAPVAESGCEARGPT